MLPAVISGTRCPTLAAAPASGSASRLAVPGARLRRHRSGIRAFRQRALTPDRPWILMASSRIFFSNSSRRISSLQNASLIGTFAGMRRYSWSRASGCRWGSAILAIEPSEVFNPWTVRCAWYGSRTASPGSPLINSMVRLTSTTFFHSSLVGILAALCECGFLREGGSTLSGPLQQRLRLFFSTHAPVCFIIMASRTKSALCFSRGAK